MQGSSKPQRSDDQDNSISTLNIVIKTFDIAKDAVDIAPAKAIFGSVSFILEMIRVRSSFLQSPLVALKHVQDSRLNEEEYIKLGIACADVCIVLERGMRDKRSEDLNQSVSEAIAQLTT